MHPTIPYLLTGLGGASLPAIAVPVLKTKLTETNKELTSELNKANKKIDSPSQYDLQDILNNSFSKSGSSWEDGTNKLSNSGITISNTDRLKCMSFSDNSAEATSSYTYYLCRRN